MLADTVTPLYLILGILAMAGVTFLTRITPIILPKKLLDLPLLLAINKGLPLAVMTLLILASLSWGDIKQQQLGISNLLISQILALCMVLISYHFWKQLFVSMLIGIASLNGFLWLINQFFS